MARYPKASAAEIEEACRLRREGFSISEVAKALGRSPSWVHRESSVKVQAVIKAPSTSKAPAVVLDLFDRAQEQQIDLKTLAKVTGYALSHILKVRLGKAAPSLKCLSDIAQALDCEVRLVPKEPTNVQ